MNSIALNSLKSSDQNKTREMTEVNKKANLRKSNGKCCCILLTLTVVLCGILFIYRGEIANLFWENSK
ncbi:CLUMA_CG010291, isoform A [Clunio marinus]|uniref:CLUMA_CG010291, isoform A n=1 Tax=Clunio marinus TaxID=568069 RepID=A0A1J1I891_9DIPT|nr:CLUMA_CG010291, isoform A [Clunio marinus]